MAHADDENDDAPNERRAAERFEVSWSVDCETPDTFLYASIGNISEFGIFVLTTEPLPVGTVVSLRFAPPRYLPFVLSGIVQWLNPVREGADNPNPGMGIRFIELAHADRERLVDVVHTIAYLRDDLCSPLN